MAALGELAGRVRAAARTRVRPPGQAALPPGPSWPAPVQLATWLYRPFELLTHCRRRYGTVFSLSLGRGLTIVGFSDPEHVREIFTGPTDVMYAGHANEPLRPVVGASSLLLLDGPRHVRERRLLVPPFHGERMHAYGETMREVTSRELERWPVGRAMPIHPPMQSVTLDVILRTVFGVEEGAELEALRSAIVALTDQFSPTTMVPWLQWDLGPRSPWGRFVRARARVDELLYARIAARRREGAEGRQDILTLMMSARYEDGGAMSDRELRDELMTLLAAGHETSASALPWAFHFLAVHPALQARVHEEIDRVRALAGGAIDPQGSTELRLLDAVLKETMRLRPVIAAVGRVLQEPRRIAGWDLPAGTLVSPSIYLTHREPSAWRDPERFDPDRFLDEKINPYAYFPFGGGARRCIGMAFALYEMRIVLATVLARFRVLPAPGVRIRPERRNVSMAPSHDMPVVLERR